MPVTVFAPVRREPEVFVPSLGRTYCVSIVVRSRRLSSFRSRSAITCSLPGWSRQETGSAISP